ncbi:MAG: indolepyruvate ferredoxin oxidoreductase, partial [Solirubrobacteraceae bacterium]|nr:indolepyruvate ferredoxin oxidoreductase [Solirubrobacteraceae bacterium]
VRVVGIGGTGVLTVSQVLQMAMLLDGRHANGLGQTGLSQKAGPVLSDLHLTASELDEGVSFPSGSADVLLGCDLIGTASAQSLRVADPQRTVAIVSNGVIPTGLMVVDINASTPDSARARAAIDEVTRARENVYVDAHRIAQRLLGDETHANVVVLGAAWQRGLLPVSLGALQEAFRLNGAAIEQNLAALAWGRACVVAPDFVAEAISDVPTPAPLSSRARELVDGVTRDPGELRRLLELRVSELLAWGGSRPARRYAEAIARVRAGEADRVPGSSEFSENVAKGLYKLMAYKDEYEVARLHLEGLATLPRGSKVKIHLHPPLLRSAGMRRKLKLGRWFHPALRGLRAGRRLRGTPLDPFGRTEVRRIERALPDEYLALVESALERLEPSNLPLALEIAALPDLVRGYEQIKLAGVERFRTRGAELREQLSGVA